MYLTDVQIKALCLNGMVTPFDETLLNPRSLDLRLGDALLVEQPHTSEYKHVSIDTYTERRPYFLRPKQFVLAVTLELFTLPQNICGFFLLKSSRARERYQHSFAGFADPGWTNSRLTLELSNCSEFHSIPLYPGLLIGQMVFAETEGPSQVDYAKVGHYNNNATVMPSWITHTV